MEPISIFVSPASRSGTLIVEVESLNEPISVLFQKIAVKLDRTPDQLRLLFGAKQLVADSGLKIGEYGIQKNSTIFAVERLRGGGKLWLQSTGGGTKAELLLDSFTVKQLYEQAANHTKLSVSNLAIYTSDCSKLIQYEMGGSLEFVGIKSGDTVCYEKKHDASDFSIDFVDAPDAITGDDDDSIKRAKMPCGHAVDPNSLTAFARSLVDRGIFIFRCPKPTVGESKCGREWEYTTVRRLALLNDAECQYIEVRLAESAAEVLMDAKVHPKCNHLVVRDSPDNKRVICLQCTSSQGRLFEFCWNCLKEWKTPHNILKCGNNPCQDPRLVPVLTCGTKDISSTLKNVPDTRFCPTCGYTIVHESQCKYMHCPRCWTEFCFSCLRSSKDCKNIFGAKYYDLCEIATRQTYLPRWANI